MTNKTIGGPLVYKDALLTAMGDALASDESVFIIGQGVDDHKGTFGSTLGLVDRYGPQRVMDVPLAEEGVLGLAVGAALNGMYPINTHIRADFSLLAMNQVINMAAKYRYMFGGRFSVPLMVRMMIGRSWGQGAQHSQSLQSLFAHIPGLTVIMPATPHAILDTYPAVIKERRGPVISLEHRLLYDLEFKAPDIAPPEDPLQSRIVREGTDVTIVATSIMVLEAMRAAEYLKDNAGISCEIIDLHCLTKDQSATILPSVEKTGRLLVADTSWLPYGVAAEMSRMVAEYDPRILRAPVRSIGMAPAPCPTAKTLEDMFYPNQHDFVKEVSSLVLGDDADITLPSEKSMVDVYKKFKGPF